MICATCQESMTPPSPACPRCGTPAPWSRSAADDDSPTIVPRVPAIDGGAERTILPGYGELTVLPGSTTPYVADRTVVPGAAPGEADRTMAPGRRLDGDQTILPGSTPDPEQTVLPGGGRATGDTGPLTPGQAFGPRYHIIKLIGLGGMGAVYQAWDAELGVVVALKVIRPEAASDPEAARDLERRFKRELLLARQVTHKNVVRIHDLGEIQGIKYITMPFVDGSDLATVLASDGPLPPPRVIRIARTALSGLVAAHQAGVVHRDLKPANIMIGADDEALIMDFGIADRPAGARNPCGAPPAAPSGARRRRRARRWRVRWSARWSTWHPSRRGGSRPTSVRTCMPSA